MASLQVDLDTKSAEASSLASKVAELKEKNCKYKIILHLPHAHTSVSILNPSFLVHTLYV